MRKKAHNYRERGLELNELDIIAFSSLKREVLDLNTHFPPPTEYLRQGWRSLSLVGPTFAGCCSPTPTRQTSCVATWGAALFLMWASVFDPVQRVFAMAYTRRQR